MQLIRTHKTIDRGYVRINISGNYYACMYYALKGAVFVTIPGKVMVERVSGDCIPREIAKSTLKSIVENELYRPDCYVK